MKKEKLSSDKKLNLDHKAQELGMGGNLITEKDEDLYKKRMQERKNVQTERLKLTVIQILAGSRLIGWIPPPRDISASNPHRVTHGDSAHGR